MKNEATDYDEDVAAWKAYPLIESIVFSGEKEKMVKLTFRVFPDLTKPVEIQYLVFGDHT